MIFRDLDPVVLLENIPSRGLQRGALGAIVHRHTDACVEVEFLTAVGDTQAVVRISTHQLRHAIDSELTHRFA
ncbi:DUF4926 domain-containing protein [bacterium]|nr:DUF4926 domain-containing protein [bacterium]